MSGGRILVAVETSSPVVSVALFRGDALVGVLERAGRADAVVAIIDELLRAHGVSVGDVERWAVDVGPGSFTGVRSGVAAVKGIAFATGAEMVAVTAFDGLGCAPSAVALLDAGKGEVYYRIGSEGEPGHAPLDAVRSMGIGDREVIGPGIAPRAELVGRAALGRSPGDLDRLEPLYVRAPDLTRPT